MSTQMNILALAVTLACTSVLQAESTRVTIPTEIGNVTYEVELTNGEAFQVDSPPTLALLEISQASGGILMPKPGSALCRITDETFRKLPKAADPDELRSQRAIYRWEDPASYVLKWSLKTPAKTSTELETAIQLALAQRGLNRNDIKVLAPQTEHDVNVSITLDPKAISSILGVEELESRLTGYFRDSLRGNPGRSDIEFTFTAKDLLCDLIEGRVSFKVSFQRGYPVYIKRTPRIGAHEIQELAREFNSLINLDDQQLRLMDPKPLRFFAGVLHAQSLENRSLSTRQFSLVETVRLFNIMKTDHPLKVTVLDDLNAEKWARDFDLIDRQPRLSLPNVFATQPQNITVIR